MDSFFSSVISLLGAEFFILFFHTDCVILGKNESLLLEKIRKLNELIMKEILRFFILWHLKSFLN